MNHRNTVSRSLFPLFFALVLGTSAMLGCGGASQPVAADPSTIPVENVPTEGFSGAASTDDSSYLDIQADPPTEVLVDGKKIGKTPIKKLKVTPGAHDVTFDDEVGGPRTMSVTVDAGDYQTVKSDRPITVKRD